MPENQERLEAECLWNRVKALCKERKVTHIQLCGDCGIDLGKFKGQLANNVAPKVFDAQKIASYFGVSVEYLVTGTESSSESSAAEMERQKLQNRISEAVRILTE